MDAHTLITLIGAALAGAVVGVAGGYWHFRGAVAQLAARLERSEQARLGAVERSAQAREQIAQLNNSITELRQAHSLRKDQQRKKEEMQRAIDQAEAPTLVLPRREPLQAFPDTQLMP